MVPSDQTPGDKVAVLFVCTGNICRSPTAEGVFRQRVAERGLTEQFLIDSAGTTDYHVGAPPDRRSQEAALARGYDLSAQRARQVETGDCARFDYIVTMDEGHLSALRHLCNASRGKAKIAPLLEYAPQLGLRDVPDPYYGGEQGFERVLDLIETACDGLLEAIETGHFA